MSPKKNKQLTWNDVSSVYELIGFIFSLILKNWKIAVFLFLMLGFVIGGCNIKTKWFEFSKDPVKIKSETPGGIK